MSEIGDDVMQEEKQIKKKDKKTGEKRGPGRPCKQPKKEMPQRKGIMQQPTSIGIAMEFWYDQPMIFKKIAQFFRLMASKSLQLLFRRDEIIIYTPDHHKKSRIRVKIDVKKSNLYYLRDPMDLGIHTKELEMILNTVNKEYGNLILYSNQGECQKCINISVEDEVKATGRHSVVLVGGYEKMESEAEFLDENYTIKLNIPGKYFKTTISDIRTMAKKMVIKQDTLSSPLEFEYITESKKIKSKHIIRNNSRINYTSTLTGDRSLCVELNIDNIKPISSALLSDNVQWYLDENKPMMFKALLDEGAVEIKILTEIIDERKTAEVIVQD